MPRRKKPIDPALDVLLNEYESIDILVDKDVRGFKSLAKKLAKVPSSPERTIALRKLIEARDAFLRAEFTARRRKLYDELAGALDRVGS